MTCFHWSMQHQRSNLARTTNGMLTFAGSVMVSWFFFSMAKQVTLTNFFKKPRIENNNYLEDHQSVDCNGTTAGSENGAEMNSEPTTSTDANRRADLPMHTPLANRRSLLHLIAPSDMSALGEPVTQPHLQVFPSTIIDGKYRSFNVKWYERFNCIEYSPRLCCSSIISGLRFPITLSLSALRRLLRYNLTEGIPFLGVFLEPCLRKPLKIYLLTCDVTRCCPWRWCWICWYRWLENQLFSRAGAASLRCVFII